MSRLDLRRHGIDRLPIAITDHEVSRPSEGRAFDPSYRAAYVLLRDRGVPVDVVLVPLDRGVLRAETLDQAAATVEHPPEAPYPPLGPDAPAVTVAVCTRDRPDDLKRCLAAFERLDYPSFEVLVVDNAPSDDRTERLVASFPRARYVREPRPGLDRARNRVLAEATHDVIAYTDDDVAVDPLWLRGIAAAFAEHPDAECVTGLTLPAALDTPAQLFFELNGSFVRGFRRRRFAKDRRNTHLSPGLFGAGANMAFRRSAFERTGPFDPALDVGTPTGGGGDIEMFLRLLEEGGTLVYEPRALVRHHHRREFEPLARQFAGWGAYYAVLTRTYRAYPHLRGAVLRRGLAWFVRRHVLRPLVHFAVKPTPVPFGLYVAEVRGCIEGLRSYDRSLEHAQRVEAVTPAEAEPIA